MGSFTIKHNVQVTGLEGLDQLANKQKNVTSSSLSLDQQLEATRTKIRSLIGDGDITPKQGSGLQKIVADYQKFGTSVADSLKTIASSQDLYGASTARLAQRVSQSLTYQANAQARASAEASSARASELAEQERFTAETIRLRALASSNIAASSPIAAAQVIAEHEAQYASLVNHYAAPTVASTLPRARTVESVVATSSIASNGIAELEALQQSKQIDSRIAQVLRTGLQGSATSGGKSVAGSEFLGILSGYQGSDKFSKELSAASQLLQSKIASASTGAERLATTLIGSASGVAGVFGRNGGGLGGVIAGAGTRGGGLLNEAEGASGFNLRSLISTVSSGLFLTTGSYGGSRRFTAAARLGSSLGIPGFGGAGAGSNTSSTLAGGGGGNGGGGGGGTLAGGGFGLFGGGTAGNNAIAGLANAGNGGGGGGGGGLFGLSLGATAAVGATAALAAAAAVTIHLANETANAAREEQNLAERTGLTITQFGQLKGAAQIVGVDINALAIGFKGLAKASENPQSSQGRALASLGVSPVDNNGRSRDTLSILKDISAAVKGLNDTEARDVIDKIIPGRSAQLLPLFKANITDLTAEVGKLGYAFTEDGAAKADAYAQRLSELDLRWQSLKRSLGQKAIGIIDLVFPKEAEGLSKQDKIDANISRFALAAGLKSNTLTTGPSPNASDLANAKALRDSDAQAAFQLQKSQQSSDANSKEGLQRQLSEAKKTLAEAVENRDKGVTSLSDQRTRGAAVTTATANVDELEKKLKAITEALAEQKNLQKELNKDREGELFGADKINAIYRDRVSLLREQGIATSANLGLLEKIREVELARNSIRQKIQEDQLTNEGNATVTSVTNATRLARTRNQTAIDRSGQTSDDPASRRDQALQDAALLQSTAATNLDATLAELINKQDNIRDSVSAGLLDPSVAAKEQAAIQRETVQAQGKFDQESDDARKEREVALNQYRLSIEKQIAEQRKSSADTDLATNKAILSIREQFGNAQTNRQTSLLSASNNPFAPSNIIGIEAQSALARRNASLSATAADIASVSAETPDSEAGRLRQQEQLNSLRLQGVKAEADYETDLYNLRTEQEVNLAKYRTDQIKSAENTVAEIFDAGVSRGSRGIGEVLTQQARGVLRTVVSNTGGFLFSQLPKDAGLGNLFPGQSKKDANGNDVPTALGSILKGTPFAAPPKSLDLPVNAIDKKTGLMQSDINAILKILQGATGSTSTNAAIGNGLLNTLSTGTRGVSFPSITTPTFNGSTVNEAIGSAALGYGIDPATGFNSRTPLLDDNGFGGAGTFSDPFGDDTGSTNTNTRGTSTSTFTPDTLANVKTGTGLLNSLGKLVGGSGDGSNLSGVFSGLTKQTGNLQGIFTGASTNSDGSVSSLSTSERLGGAIGTAGAVATGVTAAIKGFSKGGASGVAQGTGALLGTAALLDPEPISKSVLAIGAAVAGGISAILGDPKAKRAADINKELQLSQYIAPQAQNRTSDLQGNFTSTNSRGNVVSTQFSDIPIIQQGFLDKQRNVIPGQTYSQFGYAPGSDPSVTPNPNTAPTVSITNNINTLEPQNLHEYLQKNPQALNAGIHTALSSPGEAQSTIRSVVNGA